MEAADVPAYDGWYAWRNDKGERLDELRERFLSENAKRIDQEELGSS